MTIYVSVHCAVQVVEMKCDGAFVPVMHAC